MPGGKATITVRIQPNASANEVIGMADDVLRLKIATPPVKGKANQEIVKFLSKRLGLDKDDVAIVRGHTSKSKLVAIEGLSRKEVLDRLLGQRLL